LLLILGGFILFGKQFILLWVGKNYIDAWLVALIIMIAYTTPLVQAFGNLILEAKSLFSFKAIIYISCIGIGTFFGAYTVASFGILGMIISTSTGWIISIAIMNIYYHKVIGLNIPIFFRNLFSKILPVFSLIMVFGYFINQIQGDNWFNFAIKAVLYVTVYSLLMYFLGMRDSEKQLIKNVIPFIK